MRLREVREVLRAPHTVERLGHVVYLYAGDVPGVQPGIYRGRFAWWTICAYVSCFTED